MAIERDIHDLLFQADCVIVPGFGGFLTHQRGARLDEARRLIHPPAREVSFNRRLTRNDGLLADRVAERTKITHAKAVAAIEEEVKRWVEKVAADGRIEIPGIGTFFRESEGDLQFIPDTTSNYSKDALGLRTLAAVPIPRPATGAVVREMPRKSEVPNESRVPMLWAAAAITALLFGAGAWFAYQSGVMEGTQLGSFQPFGPKEGTAYHPRTTVPSVLAPGNEEEWNVPEGTHGIQALPIAGDDAPLVSVDLGMPPEPVELPAEETAEAAPDKTEVAVPSVSVGRFHVVGGCFSIKENADRFIAALRDKGFQATLIDQHRGLYRVAFGSFPERGMALEALAAVRKQEGPDAWLLVK